MTPHWIHLTKNNYSAYIQCLDDLKGLRYIRPPSAYIILKVEGAFWTPSQNGHGKMFLKN